ncbi:MAG: hypothetical protein F6J93_19975 [Oscillatoria sp. SIO1A7]|nr:hypothetical protein [Oscillatoria sp. SIO1A7]
MRVTQHNDWYSWVTRTRRLCPRGQAGRVRQHSVQPFPTVTHNFRFAKALHHTAIPYFLAQCPMPNAQFPMPNSQICF